MLPRMLPREPNSPHQEGRSRSMKAFRLAYVLAVWCIVFAEHSITYGQTTTPNPAPASGGPVDPRLIEDLVIANHVLTSHGVRDEFGHRRRPHPGSTDRRRTSRPGRNA